MIRIQYLLLVLLINLVTTISAQRGFTDTFSDSTMQLASRNPNQPPFLIWSTMSPGTYTLSERDSVLRINYRKQKGAGAYDHFVFRPPYPVNVSNNPRIQLKIRSSVSTTLTLRPYYSLKPPTYEELSQPVLGDDEWHTVTFHLYDYLYDRFGVQYVEFYFDMGIDTTISGSIELDDVKVGWRHIEISELSSQIANGDNVLLTWKSSDPENTSGYRIYRNGEVRFIPSSENLIGEGTSTQYLDTNLGAHQLYYYKIIPIGKNGEVFFAGPEVRVETYEENVKPEIQIIKINSHEIKKYEKFELSLNLNNVDVFDPYATEDIDLYALFISPSGDTIRINGFYDNYQQVNHWKVRFAPNVIGSWLYQLYLDDSGRKAQTSQQSFNAIESDHHGWIRPAKTNPHYFAHDDGTSYYPVGVYSPWRNNEERFETFARHHANMFAIWDIGYGGFVNETGIIEEELGKYNQEKLGRIDSLLAILEKDDIQLMYAIWPHDLFSESVWATEWDKNPYRHLTDVVDVYRDDLVWEYQKRKYRYLIARFGHSRSMGIWEIINEMNGTDGWKEARFESAYAWVEKVDKYFAEHDPYNHPVTASFSGGFAEYRKPLYERNDIPNIHVYPAQGWTMHYPEDTLRSDMYNYAWASRRFWNDFDKPAIFGEAGADLSYFHRDDPRYHVAYHNAIWASLTNGLAGTPIWWMYTHLTQEDWKQLSYLADFVKDIDFANQPFAPVSISAEGTDAFALAGEGAGFGWVRSYSSESLNNNLLQIHGMTCGRYQVQWFDCWAGTYLSTTEVSCLGDKMQIVVPDLPVARQDLAFKLLKTS